MSEVALEERSRLDKIRAELICSLCLDLLTEPRKLDCDHSFCQKCLQNRMKEPADLKDGSSAQPALGSSEQQPAASLVCPCCQKATTLPNEGIMGLKLNFKLKSLVDVLSEEERETTVETLGKRHKIKCHKQCTRHEEDCEFFCEDCKELICHMCMSDCHKQHSWNKYDERLHELKEALRSCVHPAYEAAVSAHNAMQQLDEKNSTVIQNQNSVKGKVEEYFDQMVATLEQRKKRLLSMVDRYGECTLDMLKQRSSDLQRNHSFLLQHLEQIEKKMGEDDVSILTGINDIKQKISLHCDDIHLALSSSESFDFTIKLKEESLPLELDQLGRLVLYQKNPCSGVVSAVQEYIDAVDMECIHVDLATPMNGMEEDMEEGDYEVMMAPMQPMPLSNEFQQTHPRPLPPEPIPKDETEAPGQHTRELLPMDPKRVANHPFSHQFQVSRPRLPLTLSQSMSSTRPDYVKPFQVIELHNNNVHPCGIACTNTYGNLFITDTNNDCLHMLHEGNIMYTFEGKKFKKPVAVAISKDNYAYLLEQENSTAVFHKLTLDGQLVFTVHKRSHKGPLKPWGIAVSKEGKVYVSDWMKCQIYIYNANSGRKIRSIKGCTRRERREEFLEFRRPAGIAIDRGGRLMVTDRGEKCVWCINTDGDELIRKIGEHHLQYPYGIGVAKDGRVVVTESESDCVSVFRENGELLQYFGGSGSNEGQFCRPHHVFVDESDRVFIADKENRRIQIFQLSEYLLHETIL